MCILITCQLVVLCTEIFLVGQGGSLTQSGFFNLGERLLIDDSNSKFRMLIGSEILSFYCFTPFKKPIVILVWTSIFVIPGSLSNSCFRTFVMPARMCINPMHNKKGLLHQSSNASSDEGWMDSSCAMDSLYDLDLISKKVPVILDNSEAWDRVLSTAMKLGARGVAHVEGMSRRVLQVDPQYANLLLLNRTASPLAWFMECKDRKNSSSVLLPHTFLPSMATKKLRDVADKIKAMLGDYDAIHVRRGDIIKTRKDRFGDERSLHPHIERDTRPEFILRRISKWVPAGRTLYIASNERTPGFFSPLGVRYKLAYSSNYTRILDPVIENNYQLFMIERLILRGAKTFIDTYKSDDSELSLTDDPKKNTKVWDKVVHTMEDTAGS
ncbi:uncharacterized protein LOC141642014 isoform X2 [Silene latifolia]|uniref:uncharacterized protein LOC141642014 isoform X2 n=1 Tax=Silene latifolia TaxID=37657 RepID=UPI003D789B49